jgi:hypothetical protein
VRSFSKAASFRAPPLNLIREREREGWGERERNRERYGEGEWSGCQEAKERHIDR